MHHFIVEFSIHLKLSKIKRKRITYRDFKNIDLPRFVSNIITKIYSPISSTSKLCSPK